MSATDAERPPLVRAAGSQITATAIEPDRTLHLEHLTDSLLDRDDERAWRSSRGSS